MNKYLSLDCEMGGIGSDKSLLSLGLVLLDENLQEVDTRHYKIKPNDGVYRVTAGGLAVNKIDIVEHDKVAQTYDSTNTLLRHTLYEWTSAKTAKLIPIGKQVDGDLAQIWDKLLSRDAWEQFVSYRKIEVSSIMLFLQQLGLLPEFKGSLTDCISYYGIPDSGLHDALEDARMTATVYKAMLNTVKFFKRIVED